MMFDLGLSVGDATKEEGSHLGFLASASFIFFSPAPAAPVGTINTRYFFATPTGYIIDFGVAIVVLLTFMLNTVLHDQRQSCGPRNQYRLIT
jgi:hypothetical protein